MSHSLGEIESLARRAARGAGMSWGLAEEAGHAVAWLCAHALPGADYLAARLHNQSPSDPLEDHPQPQEDMWQSRSGTLCPIATGAALSDRAEAVSKSPTLRLLQCDAPFLLLPFLASVAHRMRVTIGLQMSDYGALCSPKGLYLMQNPGDASYAKGDVTLTPQAPLRGMHCPSGSRAYPSEHALETLTSFAHRLHAPETEARRRTGAGEQN